jgi:hypothetical protein
MKNVIVILVIVVCISLLSSYSKNGGKNLEVKLNTKADSISLAQSIFEKYPDEIA